MFYQYDKNIANLLSNALSKKHEINQFTELACFNVFQIKVPPIHQRNRRQRVIQTHRQTVGRVTLILDSVILQMMMMTTLKTTTISTHLEVGLTVTMVKSLSSFVWNENLVICCITWNTSASSLKVTWDVIVQKK